RVGRDASRSVAAAALDARAFRRRGFASAARFGDRATPAVRRAARVHALLAERGGVRARARGGFLRLSAVRHTRRRATRLGLISATLARGSSRRSRTAAALLREAYASLEVVGAIDGGDADR